MVESSCLCDSLVTSFGASALCSWFGLQFMITVRVGGFLLLMADRCNGYPGGPTLGSGARNMRSGQPRPDPWRGEGPGNTRLERPEAKGKNKSAALASPG